MNQTFTGGKDVTGRTQVFTIDGKVVFRDESGVIGRKRTPKSKHHISIREWESLILPGPSFPLGES